MRLLLDAMGGDHAPAAVVEGGCAFAREHVSHEVVLVGHERRIGECLAAQKLPDNVRVHHAAEVVEMGEHASVSIRKKKDSSLRVCFDLLKKGEGEAVVSAGNSGAVMAGALLVLGRLSGVERPAFAALMPALRRSGRCLLLDAGANVDCRPLHLAQFAIMGEAYMRKAHSVPSPRVAVLSNGEEEGKGTVLTREVSALLKASDMTFIGYVEGKDIFSGDVEVVVTDGFTGNVVLKTSEGAAAGITGLIRSAVERAGFSEKLGALLLKPTFAALKKVIDYAEVGGAPLLGVDGVAVVAHGRSEARAIQSALKAALHTHEVALQEELAQRIAASHRWLPKRAPRRAKEATLNSASD